MNLFDISIPHMSRTLGQVPVWLDKAQATADLRKFDIGVLLTARLTPDQWHFTRQVQAMVLGPLRLANVLRGQAPPDNFDIEPTVAALRANVAQAREKLDALRGEEFAGAEARVIPLPFLPGKGLQAGDFVQQFSLPNFYFHAVTAYSILRHNGVDVGKPDFLAPLAFRDL
ncbi:DUF1993 domain-containing protein [Nannocystis bainbridge]|uniref:DUF1993 domain-containing protein n=1 Tax=Nannocystis bainbridge TaxID=2995303 RepID=A0ABT5E9W7_9BACT|nr:DUF1993 domain-containing protein [Nannocystis bainbridge]MDC0722646.1 DUF1993 domain-containing protein [Nannocystis bainbridge]